MGEKPEILTQKAVNEILGITFWRRYWGLTVAILFSPIFFTVGLIGANYPFGSAAISSASQMIVGFSSLLAAAWTFGLAYFWPSTERAVREMRALLMKVNPPPQGVARLEALKSLRMPFKVFLVAISGLILIIWSGVLAVGAALFGFGLFLLLSIVSLSFGSGLMVSIWLYLYVAREALGNFVELAPP